MSSLFFFFLDDISNLSYLPYFLKIYKNIALRLTCVVEVYCIHGFCDPPLVCNYPSVLDCI